MCAVGTRLSRHVCDPNMSHRRPGWPLLPYTASRFRSHPHARREVQKPRQPITPPLSHSESPHPSHGLSHWVPLPLSLPSVGGTEVEEADGEGGGFLEERDPSWAPARASGVARALA